MTWNVRPDVIKQVWVPWPTYMLPQTSLYKFQNFITIPLTQFIFGCLRNWLFLECKWSCKWNANASFGVVGGVFSFDKLKSLDKTFRESSF